MKRVRVESEVDTLAMADTLISLSKSNNPDAAVGRVFVCKTCNREFPSFQALGGHRASHRKPRFSSAAAATGDGLQSNAIKTKAHECSVCGVEFSVGQALGGHMRRHRNSSPVAVNPPPVADLPVSDESDSDGGSGVVGLDLNLTPLENDLVRLQLMAPPVGCFT